MDGVAKLILATIEHRVGRVMRDGATRLAGVSAVMLLAGSFAAAGIGCVMTGLWLFLLPHVGPVGAPLIVGGILLLASVALLASIRTSRAPPPPVPSVDILPALAIAEITNLFKAHKGSALIAAVLAGLTAGKLDK